MQRIFPELFLMELVITLDCSIPEPAHGNTRAHLGYGAIFAAISNGWRARNRVGHNSDGAGQGAGRSQTIDRS